MELQTLHLLISSIQKTEKHMLKSEEIISSYLVLFIKEDRFISIIVEDKV